MSRTRLLCSFVGCLAIFAPLRAARGDDPAPPRVVAVVELDVVRGLRSVDPQPATLRRPLTAECPEGLDVSALGEGPWTFGHVPLTRSESLPFAVNAARDTLFLDSDRDGRLVPAERADAGSPVGPVRWFGVEGAVRQARDGQVHEARLPFMIGVSEPAANYSLSRLNAYLGGTVELDGASMRVAVLDGTHRGIFSHRGRDRLLVDLDGDGRLNTALASHEVYRLGEAFPFGDRSLVVHEIGPLGQRLSLVESGTAARRAAILEVGHAAPDFEAQTLDGEQLSLSRLEGKWVLLEFWATWCGPCRAQVPHLKRLRTAQPDVVILGISGDRQRRPLETYVEQQGLDWPQVYDEGRPLRRLYRITSFPRSFLIAPDGKIVAKELRGAGMVQQIASLREGWAADQPAP